LSLPPSVNVAQGSTIGTFTATTATLTAAQSGTVTATYNGSSKTLNFNLTLKQVVSSIQCSPSTLGSNATATCTVTLSIPDKGAANITLTTTLPNVTVPRTVKVSSDQVTGIFAITSLNIPTTVTGVITASYNGSSQSVTLTLVGK
jgi:hypothetical protein